MGSGILLQGFRINDQKLVCGPLLFLFGCVKWCSETQDKMQYENGGLRIDLRINLGTNLEFNCNELQLIFPRSEFGETGFI